MIIDTDIVNEKPLNLEKTTSSVLSVLLLIYAVNDQTNQRFFALLPNIKNTEGFSASNTELVVPRTLS